MNSCLALRAALLLTVLGSPCAIRAQDYNGPIIDMHVHGYSESSYWGAIPNPVLPNLSPESANSHRTQTLREMTKNNVVLAVVVGDSVAETSEWLETAPSRVLAGLSFVGSEVYSSVDEFENDIDSGQIKVIAELGLQYAGLSPVDPSLEAFWQLAAAKDIPVGIHFGGGPPATPYRCCPNFRVALGSPLLMEDILVRYPKLRVYIMHAGGFYYEDTIKLMHMYPQVHVDISVLNWTPDSADLLERFIKRAKTFGFLDRVMFGSDQMVWPEAIEVAIRRVNELEILTHEERAAIFYDNAAKFLMLPNEMIRTHHQIH